MMGGMREIRKPALMAGAAKRVAAARAQPLRVHIVAIEAADIFRVVFAHLPFLIGFLMAFPAHLRRNGDGHLGCIRMTFSHGAVAGLAGHTGLSEFGAARFMARGVAGQTFGILVVVFP